MRTSALVLSFRHVDSDDMIQRLKQRPPEEPLLMYRGFLFWPNSPSRPSGRRLLTGSGVFRFKCPLVKYSECRTLVFFTPQFYVSDVSFVLIFLKNISICRLVFFILLSVYFFSSFFIYINFSYGNAIHFALLSYARYTFSLNRFPTLPFSPPSKSCPDLLSGATLDPA